jgi:MFS transporter, DHA1 family, tetracycline resistance protein
MVDSDGSNFSMVLPVLFYEYLALSITRSIMPGMLVAAFGKSTYAVVGILETVKGLLAFLACPLLGRISDKIGRKYCLLASVAGSLIFTSNSSLSQGRLFRSV